MDRSRTTGSFENWIICEVSDIQIMPLPLYFVKKKKNRVKKKKTRIIKRIKLNPTQFELGGIKDVTGFSRGLLYKCLYLLKWFSVSLGTKKKANNNLLASHNFITS